jgi:hypothetical protein
VVAGRNKNSRKVERATSWSLWFIMSLARLNTDFTRLLARVIHVYLHKYSDENIIVPRDLDDDHLIRQSSQDGNDS